jgi:hypothetical protein
MHKESRPTYCTSLIYICCSICNMFLPDLLAIIRESFEATKQLWIILCGYKRCCVYSDQWRTEGGFGGSNPLPKFRSVDEAEPNSQFRGRCIRNNVIKIRVSLICKLSGTTDWGATAPRSPFTLPSVLNWICWNPAKNSWARHWYRLWLLKSVLVTIRLQYSYNTVTIQLQYG